MVPELARVIEPAYVAGLRDRSLDELRSMRRECTDLENAVSYVRRLAQGRLDVVRAETERRADGGGRDLAELVEALPEMLSDGGMRAPGSGRFDEELDPPEAVLGPLVAELDAVVAPADIRRVADLDTEVLSAAVIGLRRVEGRLSADRRELHRVIDTVNLELAARLRSTDAP